MTNNAQQNQACLLEVIACTVEDAIEAERGGANRLEVISRFDLGGLTPSPDLVREIKAKVSLPLRVMLRENEGYAVTGEKEIEKLCAAAREFNEIGVDGVVLGFLRDEAEIDLELTETILARAPDSKATFHHAFEEARDKFSAIEKLKNLPQIDRILAHGGRDIWAEKILRLGEYATAAQPGVEILAGGGVDLQIISMIREKTSITEFHVGRAARIDGKVERSQVALLAAALTETYE
jgi:copper homeostasis protein